MTHVKHAVLAIVVLVLIVQAISFSFRGVAFANENMKPILTQIVNTSDNPIPVEGTLSGEVTVPGGVEVTNSPVVQAEQSGSWDVNVSEGTLATKPQPATTIFHNEFLSSGGDNDSALVDLPQPINASLVIVSFNGDRAVVKGKSNQANIFAVGSRHSLQTGDTVIPFPQPVRIDQIFLQCSKLDPLVPSCTASISVIGDTAD